MHSSSNLGEGQASDTSRSTSKEGQDETVSQFKEQVGEAVAESQEVAVSGFSDLAAAAKQAADDLEQREQPQIANIIRGIASGLDEISRSVARRNLGEMVSDVQRFARDRPMLFVGGAVIAGLAISRFAKSAAAPEPPAGASERNDDDWGNPIARDR
jgi:hypothetical protein